MENYSYAQTLIKKLTGYFDIEEHVTVCGRPFAFRARMHRRSEKYVLTKKNILYAFDNFEYFYLYQKDSLTEQEFLELMECFEKVSQETTIPNDEHMSSDHVLIIQVDSAEEALRKRAAKYRYRKYFRHGLQGTLKAAVILVEGDGRSAVYSRDLKDKKYQFVLEK